MTNVIEGVGHCPDRSDDRGHVWAGIKHDGSNPCVYCGLSGREFFEESTRARAESFTTLRQPESATKYGGKVESHA